MIDKQPVASKESSESSIFFMRGQKVMLSMHLAEIYEVEPRILVQAVERNIECFPEDSLFQLNPEEIAGLNLQLANTSQAAPYAFTAQGVVMLSSILLDEPTIHDNQESCAPTCSCRR